MKGQTLQSSRSTPAFLAVMLGNSAVVLDASAVNMALPRLAQQFSISPADATIVVTVYQIIVISCLLPLSALGEIIGFRRVFLFGVLLFASSSAVCAMAFLFETLLIARAFQAFGVACVMATNVALIRTCIPAGRLGTAVGFNTAAIAGSAASGPLLAGILLSTLPWHTVFLTGVPFAAAALLLGVTALPGNDVKSERSYELTSAAVTALAFGFLFTGLSSAARHLWLQAVVMIGAGLCFFFYLTRRMRRIANPILPLDILSTPVIAISVAASVCCFTVEMLSLISLPFVLQTVHRIEPAAAGALFGLWPLTLGLTAAVTGILADRVSPAVLGTLGMSVLGIGLGLIIALPESSDMWALGARMILCGVGFGLFLTPNNRIVISATPRARIGAIGGVLATARLTGQTIGTALAAFALTADAPLLALKVALCFALLAAALSVSRVWR
jgi:DHA2 family multidrug resistance protein-like MFS transporter